MHFALPPRKTSHPPPYARASAASPPRRRVVQLASYVVLGLLTLVLMARFLLSGEAEADTGAGAIEGPQDVVLVTVLDPEIMSDDYLKMVTANRIDYAARHGYKTFFVNASDYDGLLGPSPASWSLIPALRQAITENPSSTFFWALSADALVTAPALSLESHIFADLETLMQKDVPIVPPDSIIRTFSHLKPSRTHLILSQDIDNVAHTSLILKNTVYSPDSADNWAAYFLDAWFDPLLRSYDFQKAENHALEHILQWHPTLLAKVVLIEQRLINSYNYAPPPQRDPMTGQTYHRDSMWQEGDFVINMKGCRDVENANRDCEEEMREYFARWEKEVEKLDGVKPVTNIGPPPPKKAPEA